MNRLEEIKKEKMELRKALDSKDCDLNDIDTSLIIDMSFLFNESKFIGNISNWDTSNVKNRANMFVFSKFDQDISNWKIREDCITMTLFTGSRTSEEHKPKSLQRC